MQFAHFMGSKCVTQIASCYLVDFVRIESGIASLVFFSSGGVMCGSWPWKNRTSSINWSWNFRLSAIQHMYFSFVLECPSSYCGSGCVFVPDLFSDADADFNLNRSACSAKNWSICFQQQCFHGRLFPRKFQYLILSDILKIIISVTLARKMKQCKLELLWLWIKKKLKNCWFTNMCIT